ncbi:MAG: hypothetical protein SFU98_22380 [Leptospiraceae bacterium]|nr:hypothetical protein [Leptospiraceae bacterium]
MKASTQSENQITKDDLKTLISYMDKRFEDMYRIMDKRFEDMHRMMDKRFEDMHKLMDKRFDDVNKRFDDVNKRFDDANKRFDDLNQKFNWNLWLIGIILSIGLSVITYQNQKAIDDEKKFRSGVLYNLLEELKTANPKVKEKLKKILE